MSIEGSALLIEAGGEVVAEIILSFGATRILFRVKVWSLSRSIISLIRWVRRLATRNGSRVEVVEDEERRLLWVDIVPPLKRIDAELMIRKVSNAIAGALVEEEMEVRRL